MARVRVFSTEFHADPIKQLPNGNWLMRARTHGPRFAPGTELEVALTEIVEMAAAETPPDPAAGQGALESAMAAERETLPSVTELLAAHRKSIKEAPDGQVQA